MIAGLGLFQAALIAGAPLGQFAWGGQQRVLPARLRVGSVVAILLYGAFALVIVDRARLLDVVPDWLSYPAAWVVTAYLVVGVLMNAISRSMPERLAMTPVAFVLLLASLLVALG